MKLLALNGSHRGDQGHTRFLIDRLFEGAAAAGADCEVITLAKLKINRCLGCDQCQVDGRLQCVFTGKDDAQAVFGLMAQADLIVYATPVYIFNLSASLKTLLERFYGLCHVDSLLATDSGRLFHHVDRAVCSKPFVSLICCDNLESDTPRTVRTYFRAFSQFMDAPHVGELVRNGGLLAGYGHDPAAARRLPKLPEIYAAYAQAGRELATAGRIRPATQGRANQELVPVPLFGLLKRLPFKPLKQQMVVRAQAMQAEVRSVATARPTTARPTTARPTTAAKP